MQFNLQNRNLKNLQTRDRQLQLQAADIALKFYSPGLFSDLFTDLPYDLGQQCMR